MNNKAPLPDGECRILSSARCLSEGVDVPALDAVMFLHPRNSVVDVVQSVGQVMRKADSKDYGYIILPVAVPAGVTHRRPWATTAGSRWCGRCSTRCAPTMTGSTRW